MRKVASRIIKEKPENVLSTIIQNTIKWFELWLPCNVGFVDMIGRENIWVKA